MTPIGPLASRRIPEHLRRQIDVAAAAAWEALVEVHAGHAVRYVGLMAAHLDFDEAVDRFLDAMDVRDPMAQAVRSRVLVALEHAFEAEAGLPTLNAFDDDEARGINRFRPDVIMKGIVRKVREDTTVDEWTRLAVARAEEGVIRAHVDNAVVFATLLQDQEPLNDAVDDYLELLRVAGGRAQSVHQRAMAQLAERHLPPPAGKDDPAPDPGPS